MNLEEILQLSDDIGFNKRKVTERMEYFRAMWVGITYPDHPVPDDSDVLKQGYLVGRELHERFK